MGGLAIEPGEVSLAVNDDSRFYRSLMRLNWHGQVMDLF
jgi:hypothetical protein